MRYEKSCGAVLVDTREESPKFLVIEQIAKDGMRYWSFPKGHVQAEENERITAKREVARETGLDVEFVGEFRSEIRYAPHPDVMKTVVLFLGKSENPDALSINPKDIASYAWLELDQARDRLKFEDMKDVLEEADAYLRDFEDEET